MRRHLRRASFLTNSGWVLQAMKRGPRGAAKQGKLAREWRQRNKTQFPRALIPLPPFPCQTIGAAALKVAPQRWGQHAEEERKTARGGGLFSPRVERRETTAEIGRKGSRPLPPSTVPRLGSSFSCRSGPNQSRGKIMGAK